MFLYLMDKINELVLLITVAFWRVTFLSFFSFVIKQQHLFIRPFLKRKKTKPKKPSMSQISKVNWEFYEKIVSNSL